MILNVRRQTWGKTNYKQKYSFAYEVNSLYHEVIHVQQAINNPVYYFTLNGEREFNAYYRSMTNGNLPSLLQAEKSSLSWSAISELMTHMPVSSRPNASQYFNHQIDYFLGNMTKQQATQIKKLYKF